MIDPRPRRRLDRGMKATLFALFVALLLVGCAEYTTVDLDNPAIQKEMIMTAKLGDAIAQYNLGLMYEQGKGVPQDYKEAVKWYRKSAEQGLADAQSMVGVCHADGLGVAKKPIEGYPWYNIAIANGDEDAEEWIKEIELSPEQLIEAQSLSTEIYKRIEANKED